MPPPISTNAFLFETTAGSSLSIFRRCWWSPFWMVDRSWVFIEFSNFLMLEAGLTVCFHHISGFFGLLTRSNKPQGVTVLFCVWQTVRQGTQIYLADSVSVPRSCQGKVPFLWVLGLTFGAETDDPNGRNDQMTPQFSRGKLVTKRWDPNDILWNFSPCLFLGYVWNTWG